MPRLPSSALVGLAITVLDLSIELLRFLRTAVPPGVLCSLKTGFCASSWRTKPRLTDAVEDQAGVPVALIGLEAGIGHRSATDPDSVAPPRVLAVPGREVKTGKAAPPTERSQLDR